MEAVEDPRPRRRSAFAAAFLSLLFPGLGHAYARAWHRAIAFAAPPFLLCMLLLGVVVSDPIEVLGFLPQPPVLIGILAGNVFAYLYRIVAAVDAYRVVAFTNRVAAGGGRLGPARARLAPISLAGLLSVVLVMGGVHVAVAYYDLQALDFVSGVFNPSDESDGEATPSPSLEPGETPGPTETPLPTLNPSASALPTEAPTLQPWDGTSRLNILLIGSDKRPKENSYNTDTLIVMSIDPTTRQVAMFSLPRDTSGVPLPAIPARSVFGSVYPGKINSLFQQARARPDLFPGGGYAALKQTLGYLYKIPIHYFIEVDFTGFKKVIDALGGVTINVQMPVVDDHYPGDDGTLRVYIPAGVTHMTGAQALIYARSRHGSSDFDRAARQQRVILSVRAQTDFATILSRFDELKNSLKSAVKTDIPPAKLPQLLELASRIDIANVRSYVFSPPLYATDLWPVSSNVIPKVSRIRAAVANAFNFTPSQEAERVAVADEGAQVWVLNGTATRGRASDVADYLDYRGLFASAPNQRPTGAVPADTVIRVYNGAELRLPKTIALLTEVFGVAVTPVTDPAVKVDVIVTIGTRTPKLQAPVTP